jgi:hypothetical protein
MTMRMPLAARIGVALILIGVALHVGWARWAATRTWVPLDIPIPLSRGHMKTGEFKINLESTYWMEVEVERKFDFDGVPCLLGFGFDECKNTPGVLKASWSLSNEGRVVARGDTDHAQGMLGGTRTMGRELGSFAAGKGQHYVVDLDVLEDGTRLNAGNPRLRILELGGSYPEYQPWHISVFLATVFFLPVGGALLISSFVRRDHTIVSLTERGPHRGGLHFDSESGPTPREPLAPKRGLRLPATVWSGIGLIFLGIASYTGIQYWMATRSFVAVNIPVSLAPGHLRTGPFQINLRGWYSIWIDLDQNRQFDVNCLPYSALRTRWVLHRDGKVVEESDKSSMIAI